jgi:hypothetical protein
LHSPRYTLDAAGTVGMRGHFDDGQGPPSFLRTKLQDQLQKSAIVRMLKNLQAPTTEDDVRLLLAIVRKSRDLLTTEYPGIKFHILLWRNFEYEERDYHALWQGFIQMGIPVHLVDDILPEYDVNPQKYWIHQEDRHSNALANRLLARYVTTDILSIKVDIEAR